MAERVGIVGLGLMGSAFSHHLLQNGFEVRGYDVATERMKQFREHDSVAFIEILRQLAGLPERV